MNLLGIDVSGACATFSRLCYFGAPWYSVILQWYRQQRSDHYRYPSSSDDIQVVYESKNYIVVNKDDLVPIDAYDAPAQVNVTQQVKKWFQKRETERFLKQDPPATEEQTEQWSKGLAQKVEDIRYCHRLDLGTSGCMCYARSPVANFLAYKAFIDKRVLKYYLALVHGHVQSSYPIYVDVPIGENASCYGRIMCTNDHPHCTSPKPAQSHVDVLEHGEYDGKPATKVLVRILTGKRHQIRLHMNYLGHPIIGDYLYTEPIDYKPHRIMLHARSLTIHTEQELIDALSKDPFVTQFDPKWKKTKTVYPVNRW